MNFDDRPQAEESQQDQEYARHDRGDGQSLDAVLLDDAIDDHDECTCGAADLYATAAERRCEEAGDDGRDDAFSGETPDAMPKRSPAAGPRCRR